MGRQTISFKNEPVILAAESVVGKREGAGPLGQWFDVVSNDDTFGQSTWEKSESMMLRLHFSSLETKLKNTLIH